MIPIPRKLQSSSDEDEDDADEISKEFKRCAFTSGWAGSLCNLRSKRPMLVST